MLYSYFEGKGMKRKVKIAVMWLVFSFIAPFIITAFFTARPAEAG